MTGSSPRSWSVCKPTNERMADTISGETVAKKLLLHAVHNVSRQDFEAGLGYLDFMRGNVENLKEALY